MIIAAMAKIRNFSAMFWKLHHKMHLFHYLIDEQLITPWISQKYTLNVILFSISILPASIVLQIVDTWVFYETRSHVKKRYFLSLILLIEALILWPFYDRIAQLSVWLQHDNLSTLEMWLDVLRQVHETYLYLLSADESVWVH